MAKKKSRVKSVKRSERMKALWADPAYKAKMAATAKVQRDREIAAKKSGVTTQETAPKPGASAAPVPPDPSARPTPAPKSERRGWTTGRAWR
jgi:hypothetical protein